MLSKITTTVNPETFVPVLVRDLQTQADLHLVMLAIFIVTFLSFFTTVPRFAPVYFAISHPSRKPQSIPDRRDFGFTVVVST